MTQETPRGASGAPTNTRRPLSESLRFRVAAVLAAALLPIGVVGIVQNQTLAQEVQNRSELTLLALTNRAAFGERQIVERAFGAAEALSSVLQLIRDDPESCRDYLGTYLETTGRYSFIGFLRRDGTVTCSSAGQALNFSADPNLPTRMANPRPWISAIAEPRVSQESVINILQPAYADGAFSGYISISMPLRLVLDQDDSTARRTPASLTTFNSEGEVLSTESSLEDGFVARPVDIPLTSLTNDESATFVAMDQSGVERSFALVPIIPGLAYALAAWPLERDRTTLAGVPNAPALVPLLMFIASVAVVFFAVDRLAVRHVTSLRKRMLDFSRTRKLDTQGTKGSLASEFRDLETAFADMAFSLISDEAQMEDALREKNVLLKEVHHRVKNNLQLISSIMNMQMRRADHPETASILKRLQERVLGLATVHRNLYQAENLSQTNAGKLLSELFNALVVSGEEAGRVLNTSGDFDEIILYPDQAVPLSLLASELVTNALKYTQGRGDEPPQIRASLHLIEPGIVRFSCENSVEGEPGGAGGTGLGSQLIRAFAAQLGGKVETEVTDTSYSVAVVFNVTEFDPEPADH